MFNGIFNRNQRVEPIPDDGYWGYINGDWRLLIGHFDIEDLTPTFYVYYRERTNIPDHSYNINRYIAERNTFIWSSPEEMTELRPEYLI